MVETDRDDLAEMVETLAEKDEEWENYWDLFYAARRVAQQLNYKKVDGQLKKHNIQGALDILNSSDELTH